MFFLKFMSASPNQPVRFSPKRVRGPRPRHSKPGTFFRCLDYFSTRRTTIVSEEFHDAGLLPFEKCSILPVDAYYLP